MIWSFIGFVMIPALLCASVCSWWVNDYFVLLGLPNVVSIVMFMAYMVAFFCIWGVVYVMFRTKNIKEYIAKLGVFISGVVCLTTFLKRAEFPNSYILGIFSLLCMAFWAAMDAPLSVKKENELEISEKITELSEKFPVLFTWAYAELHILYMKNIESEAIRLALHMDRLGWLDDARKQMIINKYGDIFCNENIHSSYKPIQLYALKELMLFIYSEDTLSEEDIEELKRLCKEMKKLGWLNDANFSEKQKERLYQLGIDINNC